MSSSRLKKKKDISLQFLTWKLCETWESFISRPTSERPHTFNHPKNFNHFHPNRTEQNRTVAVMVCSRYVMPQWHMCTCLFLQFCSRPMRSLQPPLVHSSGLFNAERYKQGLMSQEVGGGGTILNTTLSPPQSFLRKYGQQWDISVPH